MFFKIDLALRLFRGNFSSPNNTMLVGNLVTNELYGYSNSAMGIWKYSSPFNGNRTMLVYVDFSDAQAVPSSTVNVLDNTMWISLYGSRSDAWFIADLNTDSAVWAATGDLDGLFDFNPETITSEEI